MLMHGTLLRGDVFPPLTLDDPSPCGALVPCAPLRFRPGRMAWLSGRGGRIGALASAGAPARQ